MTYIAKQYHQFACKLITYYLELRDMATYRYFGDTVTYTYTDGVIKPKEVSRKPLSKITRFLAEVLMDFKYLNK